MHLRLYQVTGLLVVIAAIMFAVGLYVAEMMNNVRSYVRGENLWAKAQAESVSELYKYAYSQDAAHLENARALLAVNLGDKKARLAMKANPPDREQAALGLLEGANHPDDIPGMITLFIYYQDISYLQKAIQIWADADTLITELQQLTNEIQTAFTSGQSQQINLLITRLDYLNLRLREKEIAFSAVLGEGARWIKSTLVIVYSILFVLLLIIAILVARNIARQLQATETKLRISDNRFTSLFRSDLVGIVECHMDGRIFDANKKFLSIIGYDKGDVAAHQLNWRSLTVPESDELDRKAISELQDHGTCEPYDKQLRHADGHSVPIYTGAVLLEGEDQTGLAFVIDQTEKHRMEQELRLSAIVMDHSQDGIVILDEKRQVMSANQAFCDLAVCDNKKLVGQTFNIIHSRMDEEERLAIRKALELKENWEGDIDFQTSEGNLIPIRLSISIIQDENHEYGQYVLMLSDIKSRKAAEERLHYLANFDMLTGIANRATFQSRLHRAIARAQRHNTECAILFIDLNKFKPVNDRYGHEIGDALLKQVADRTTTVIRAVDTAARIGGDEFVVILEDIEDRSTIKQIVKRIIETVAEPYNINGVAITISCSVGISVYPHDGLNDIDLTRSADIAMYAAKSKGESQYYFFNQRLMN